MGRDRESVQTSSSSIEVTKNLWINLFPVNLLTEHVTRRTKRKTKLKRQNKYVH